MPSKQVVEGVLRAIRLAPDTDTVELKARGNAISVAVDISEILKRELNIGKSYIKTGTTEKFNKHNNLVKTSEISITLKLNTLYTTTTTTTTTN